MHSDGVVEQPTQFVVVLITHVDNTHILSTHACTIACPTDAILFLAANPKNEKVLSDREYLQYLYGLPTINCSSNTLNVYGSKSMHASSDAISSQVR